MENTVIIALKNDSGEWKLVTKTNNCLTDDAITNKKSPEYITIEKESVDNPALFEEDFDAYVYCSQKEFNEEEIAYLYNEALQSSYDLEKEVVFVYSGKVSDKEGVKSRIVSIDPAGKIITDESYTPVDEIDMIDLASFVYVQYESIKEKDNTLKKAF